MQSCFSYRLADTVREGVNRQWSMVNQCRLLKLWLVPNQLPTGLAKPRQQLQTLTAVIFKLTTLNSGW